MDIKRISYKKIQIKNQVNITCDKFSIGETELSTIYKTLKGEKLELSKYLKNTPSDKIINKLSQLYGIKKKFISIRYILTLIIVDDIEFEVMIPKKIIFKDIDWYIRYNRELKIRQILYN